MFIYLAFILALAAAQETCFHDSDCKVPERGRCEIFGNPAVGCRVPPSWRFLGWTGERQFSEPADSRCVVPLTPGTLGASAAIIIPNPREERVMSMAAQWESRLDKDINGGADGYAFSWGSDVPPANTRGLTYTEEGYFINGVIGKGLIFVVDTYDNGSGDLVGLSIKYNGIPVREVPMFIPRGTGEYIRVSASVTTEGQATFQYGLTTLTARLPNWAGFTRANFIFTARTGGAADRQTITAFKLTAGTARFPEGACGPCVTDWNCRWQEGRTLCRDVAGKKVCSDTNECQIHGCVDVRSGSGALCEESGTPNKNIPINQRRCTCPPGYSLANNPTATSVTLTGNASFVGCTPLPCPWNNWVNARNGRPMALPNVVSAWTRAGWNLTAVPASYCSACDDGTYLQTRSINTAAWNNSPRCKDEPSSRTLPCSYPCVFRGQDKSRIQHFYDGLNLNRFVRRAYQVFIGGDVLISRVEPTRPTNILNFTLPDCNLTRINRTIESILRPLVTDVFRSEIRPHVEQAKIIDPSADCKIISVYFYDKCGDGKRTFAEDCDDGNLETGDGCDNTCHREEGWSCNPREPRTPSNPWRFSLCCPALTPFGQYQFTDQLVCGENQYWQAKMDDQPIVLHHSLRKEKEFTVSKSISICGDLVLDGSKFVVDGPETVLTIAGSLHVVSSELVLSNGGSIVIEKHCSKATNPLAFWLDGESSLSLSGIDWTNGEEPLSGYSITLAQGCLAINGTLFVDDAANLPAGKTPHTLISHSCGSDVGAFAEYEQGEFPGQCSHFWSENDEAGVSVVFKHTTLCPGHIAGIVIGSIFGVVLVLAVLGSMSMSGGDNAGQYVQY